MDRTEKASVIASLNETFGGAGVVIVARYTGMTVSEISKLRSQMRAAGASFKVAKNRLAKRALEGTGAEGIANLFTGPTGVAISADPVSAPKVAVAYAKENAKFVVLGGAMGKTMLDAKAVEALATLPSLDQLRAKLIGLLQAPATKVAGVLQAPAGQLARVFGAYAKKGEAA